MPRPYTGNAANVHPPAAAPGLGVLPILSLPINGDPVNGSVFEQPFETLADYIAYLIVQLAPATPPFFGDGSDGAGTVTGGSTTLSGVVKNYTNLTISSTGILVARRSIIRCTGTLSIDPAGLLHANGANASGATAGQGSDGIGGSITTPCPVGGGTSGGAGATAANTAGSPGKDFAATTNTAGLPQNAEIAYIGRTGAGATGGAATGGAGGAGGCSGGTTDDDVLADLMTLFTPGFARRTRYASHNTGLDIGAWGEIVPLRGGPGGGGGGVGATSGTAGGGGAGGDTLWIFAKTVVFGATTCVQARGGNGANGSGTNAAGGAGGRGGRIIVFHGGATGSLDATTVNGGTAGTGTGTGATASASSAGQLLVKQVA